MIAALMQARRRMRGTSQPWSPVGRLVREDAESLLCLVAMLLEPCNIAAANSTSRWGGKRRRRMCT